MSSPKNVNSTVIELAPVNMSRYEIVLENTGNQPVYLCKQKPGQVLPTPSETNYDYVLSPSSREGEGSSSVLKIISVSRFLAVSPRGQGSTVAVMETVFL